MLDNENDIGSRAVLDVSNFAAGEKKLDAMIAAIEGNLDKLEKEQTARARRTADEEEKSTKRITAAAQQSAQAHQKSINQIISGFRSAAFVLAGITAGLVLNYKKLDEAARALGDTEIVAEFDALDTSVAALGDTLLASEIELLKVADILSGMTSIVETLRQSVAIATGTLVYMLELLKGVTQAGFQVGIKGIGSIGIGGQGGGTSLGALDAAAREKANAAFMNAATALERTQAADREKEAQKERDKNAGKLADYITKIRDLQIKSGEDLQNAEKDYQDKSAQAWQTYMDKVSDIVAEGVKKRAELTRTYNDTIAKAEQDYARGAEEASYNHNKKLADIERDYQDSVRNIQQTFQEDALDAVRNLDAIALIRAKEKRDKDLANAAQTRDRANQAENENYGRQLAELQRALEDKKREAEDAYQRGLDDQRRAEQEATQEAKDTLNQQNADAKQAYDQRLADINNSYVNERNAAQAHYLAQENALRAHLEAMRAIMASYGMDLGAGATSPIVGGGTRRRAEGGVDIVNRPTNFIAGEGDSPELVITAPMNRMLPSPVTQTVNHIGDFSHNIDAAINSSVAGLDGRIMAAVRKAIAEVVR